MLVADDTAAPLALYRSGGFTPFSTTEVWGCRVGLASRLGSAPQ